MKPVRVVLGLVAGLAHVGIAGPGVLKGVEVIRSRDSVRIDLDFGEGRPARFRVSQASDPTKKPLLQIEFQPASVDPRVVGRAPGWLRFVPGPDGALTVRVDLERDVPWKSEWRDRVLQVSFPDHLRTRPGWRNPWLVAGFSAAVAGGTAFWLLGGGAESPPSSDEGIPPPDIVLPR